MLLRKKQISVRAKYQLLMDRLKEPRKFIQVIMGAWQMAKSTVVKQFLVGSDIGADCVGREVLV